MNDSAVTERSYIAFISYRHAPLDREAAERVQKKIENYVVPKEFREQAGGRKLGVCFRDEDELPASSSLTDSIYYALDHTKFLIVICTPNLPLSKWCEAEIKYFLKTHDRDHILAVLADGTPDESFSPYMLHDFDEDGNITKDWEPLAANIAGENHTINKKAFNKEATRLCAAMIGCPFDALWQRERRARTNRLLTAAGAAVAVMAVFLGVVLNRNAQISAANERIQSQNDQIIAQNDELTEKNDEIQKQNDKIEEQNTELQSQLSTVLVDSGITKLENHDIDGALEDALASLESDDPEVYDHRAEKLLADALGAYKAGVRQSKLVYQQTTDIQEIKVTQDEQFAILSDLVGTIRCLDLSTWEVVWEYLVKDKYACVYTNASPDRVIVKRAKQVLCLSVADGSVLWSYNHDSPNYCQCISEDGSLFAVLDTKEGEEGTGSSEDGSNDLFRPVYAVFLDTETGEETGRSQLSFDQYGVRTLSDFFKAKNYGTAFSSDNSSFFLSLYFDAMDSENESSCQATSFMIDLQTLESVKAGALTDSAEDAGTLGNLYFGSEISNDGSEILFAQFDQSLNVIRFVSLSRNGKEYACSVENEGFIFTYGLVSNDNNYEEVLRTAVPALFDDSTMILAADSHLFFYDKQEKTVRYEYQMDSLIRSALWYGNGKEEKALLEITTENGDVISRPLSNNKAKSSEYAIDQEDVLLSVPLNGGLAQNQESGCCLIVNTSTPGNLYLVRFISDPSAGISIPDCGSVAGQAFDYVPGGNTGMFLIDSHDDPRVFLVDRSTGEYTAVYEVPGELNNYSVYMQDETHLVQQNVIYSLEEGTTSAYVEFPEREDSEYIPIDEFVRVVRLTDGRLMASGIGIYLRNHNALSYYPVWIDGSFIRYTDELMDPTEMVGEDDEDFFKGWIPQLGRNGVFMDYGQHTSEDGSIEKEGYDFYVSSLITGTSRRIENKFPEYKSFIAALATQSEQMAVLYENGILFLYDLAKEDPRVISSEESDSFGAQNETIALCFSDGDDYLVSLTSTGIIRIIDLKTAQIRSFTSEQFRTYTTRLDSGIRTLFGTINFLRATVSEDGKSLFISCGQESDGGELIIIDTESWTVRAEAELTFSPDPEYNRIYAYTYNWNGKGEPGIVSYPVHTLDDLKAWAISELKK